LRHRPRHHRRQQPIDRLRLVVAQLVVRQAVDHRKAHPLLEDAPHLGHRRVAIGHVEIGGTPEDRRQRMGADVLGDAADLVEAGAR
jgi:hypothetical protein